jgi:hypothetical protein
MNDRIIKNYDSKLITKDFLYNTNNWDLIELNYNIDSAKLKQWWDAVLEKFPHMIFDFNEESKRLELEKSKQMVEKGYCGYYCGPIDGITLAWPNERDEPLPPPVQANLEMFPEVNRDTFFYDAKIMPKFLFGYFKDLVDHLGADTFRQAIVTRHYPGMFIRQHIDSKVLKLHIPIEGDNSKFVFGKDKEHGEYQLVPGKMYILNTGDWHGTTNESKNTRSHLISRVADWHILNLIGMSNE